ncbi:carbon-nitrogen hydrolase family protein [Chelatococcus sp. SYSU_G07232]|uniref:Carbon-nitrogen hydrolase family protein n=1 Tax=Chelatococcus albus TaxID=3047466 RepID=A0ABT7AE25_9HYPH|nr:carbon-nitrogen hydrolase family protein [Chelatococcus sp. SYSU_G07232]MDJ1157635.1 carbon-nitrogen hydrolase family protein [Chelatococcus sp. SYSU_G07232]
MKVAQIQMNTREDKEANLETAARLVTEAVEKEGPDLIVLPEYYAALVPDPTGQQSTGEAFPEGTSYRLMSGLAARHKVTIHAGSVVEKAGNQFFNTTLVFGPDGREIARYRKIHLFDVVVPGGLRYLESETVGRGEEVVTYRVGEYTVGCAICYDLRFPELFRKLRDRGADVIVLPAAFTLQTGKDHWETLCRARAIETQTYFLATGQVGTHAGGRKACWGHTMTIDPWGSVIAQASDREGFITARLDKGYLAEIRRSLPVADHHVLG